MTINKAIELLRFEEFHTKRPRGEDFWDAVKLLIEAGIRLQGLRTGKFLHPSTQLPGETND